jgi:hypothetical protein
MERRDRNPAAKSKMSAEEATPRTMPSRDAFDFVKKKNAPDEAAARGRITNSFAIDHYVFTLANIPNRDLQN